MAKNRNRTKIKRELKTCEQSGLNRHWRGPLLDYLAESSNVTQSAEKAGINPSRAYKVRREEPEFARQWMAALYEGYIRLELEVLRRLREGDMQGENSDKCDFANAIRLLAAHRDNAGRAPAEHRNVSAAEVHAPIDRKVEAIRQQVREERERSGSPQGRGS